MKKEILRINHLTYTYTQRRKLENISLCILEGECVGLLGLTYSGKDLLVQLLSGDIEENMQKHSVYIDGNRVTGSRMLKEKIYKITASNYRIDDWTVAEYIEMVGSGWQYILAGTQTLEAEVRKCFDELGIEISVSTRIRDLSEREKRIVDLAKAYHLGARVVILEDGFEGMSLAEVRRFVETMKRVIDGRMAVIASSYSNEIMSFLPDKYIIFRKGHIVKKCARSYIRDGEHLEKFLLGERNRYDRPMPYETGRQEQEGRDVVYGIRNLRLAGGKRGNFDFRKGEIVTFLVPDRRVKERLFMVLSGNYHEPGSCYIFGSGRYNEADSQVFDKEKVASVKYLGSSEEIFPKLSVGENLLLPSLKKLSSAEYVISSGKIFKMLAGDRESEDMELDVKARELGPNSLISITLERWYIYNPKVLILFEPFALCDINGVSIVKSYLKKFAARGTAIIIVKTRSEYIEDISNHIIDVE